MDRLWSDSHSQRYLPPPTCLLQLSTSLLHVSPRTKLRISFFALIEHFMSIPLSFCVQVHEFG